MATKAVAAATGQAERRARPTVIVGVLAALLLVVSTVSVTAGSASIDAGMVWRIVLDSVLPGIVLADWTAGQERIVLDLRLPRILLGILVGAGLATVGTVLQAVTRNPLADPYLFGVSAGASVGAVAVIVHLGDAVGVLTLPLAAFAGAASSLVLVLAAATTPTGISRERLLLAGVAVSFVLMAVTNFLIFSGDQRAAHAVVFWMLGGLGLARWDFLPLPAVVVGAGLLGLALTSRTLDALLLGDETAQSLGVPVARTRVVLFAVCALLTGTLVALAGAIGFVGLMVPHIARRLVGGRHRVMLPVAALSGALLVVTVDILARTALSPQELPLGIITGAVGGFFFIWLLRRRIEM